MPYTDYDNKVKPEEEKEIEINTPEEAIEHLKLLKKKS